MFRSLSNYQPNLSTSKCAVFILALLLLATHIAQIAAKPYTHLTYAQIHYRLVKLSRKHPNLLRIYSAQDRFSLPHVGNCSELSISDDESSDDSEAENSEQPAPCSIWVVELSNFDTLPSDPGRAEWLVSGELHGDEVVGPLTVLAFIEYMVTNYDIDSFARRMLDTRLSILVPMTNAIGYHKGIRSELQDGQAGKPPIPIDPNRDFGYDQNPEKCMQTVAARALNELFRVHLFRVAITFHGGMNALGYEWGDTSHCDNDKCHPAPDFLVMHALASRMTSNAGPAGTYEQAYPIGDMGSLVYSVHGGLEDWGYGASWTTQAVVCTPATLGGYLASKTAIDRKTKRTITFLVETSREKRPEQSELGSSDDVTRKGGSGDGHLPRNIRLLFSAIDAIEPYIILNNLTVPPAGGVPQASWSVSGSFFVDSTALQWSLMNGSHHGLTTFQNGSAGLPVAGGVGTRFSQHLPSEFLTAETPLYYRIAAIVDQRYARNPPGSVPDMTPQSHLMGSRASSKWTFSVDGRTINGKRVLFSETVVVRTLDHGVITQSWMKDANWGDIGDHELYSKAESDLFDIMMKPFGGGVELIPSSSVSDGKHFVLIAGIGAVTSIVAVAVVIYMLIRYRRNRRDRPLMKNRSYSPFDIADLEDEHIALSSENHHT